MRIILFITFSLLFLCSNLFSQGFVENKGQWNGTFNYKVDIRDGAAFLEQTGITFHFIDRSGIYGPHGSSDSLADNIEHHHAIKFEFLGANDDAIITGKTPYSKYNNYFLGSDSDKWKTEIHPTKELFYDKVYNGIDLRIKEFGEHLKYEFVVSEGVDYRDVRIKILQADGVKLDRDGNIIISTAIGDLLESKPRVFQERGNKRWQVDAEFILSNTTISYSIPQYDTSLPLIIDPELIFSSFSGSTSDNWGYTATPDRFGNLYGGSGIYATGYPTTLGAFDISYNGPGIATAPADAVISKFNSAGTSLIYSTYFGGERIDIPHSMIVDEDGNLHLLGTTSSDSLPTTSNAHDQTFNGGTNVTTSSSVPYAGSDMFVVKFNETGTSLIGSTYLGGSGNDGLNTANATRYNYADESRGEINLDNDGDVIVVSSTNSANFPGTNGSFQPTKRGQQDGIIVKLNSDLTDIEWSSYIGGVADDATYGVAIAKDNTLYICGGTASGNFPVTSGAFQATSSVGRCDGYVSHISENGKTLLNSTFHGSATYDQMYLIQLDRDDHPHVFGQTQNNGNHFILGGAAFNDVGGGQVVTHFRPDLGSVVWSTQFGPTSGRPNISPTSFLVDVCNSIYLAGWGGNTNQSNGNGDIADVGGLPTTNDAFKQNPDQAESEFYLCVLDSDADVLVFGSFYGGDQTGNIGGEHVDGGTSRFDQSGKIYQAVCAGCGGENDFPIEPDPGAWGEQNGSSNCNLGVFKIDFELPIIIADFNAPIFGCAPFNVQFDNQSLTQNSSTFFWDFGNGVISTSANPSQTYLDAGTYIVRLVVSDPGSCNLHDTIEKEIVVKQDTGYSIPSLDTCIGTPIQIGPDPALFDYLENANISWIPSQFVSDANALNPFATLNQTMTLTLVIDYGGCSERITQTVNIDFFDTDVSNDTIVCSTFSPFSISGRAIGINATYEWSNLPDFSVILGTDSTLLVNDLPLAINRFFFRATKENGCSIIDTVQVTVSDKDIKLTSDTSICQDQDAIVEAISQDPKNTFNYYWTYAPYLQGSGQELLTDTTDNFIIINQVEAVTYHLFATSLVVDGCNARDSVTILVSALSQASVQATASKDSFYLGEKVQLAGTPSEGFFFSWTPELYLDDAEIANPIAQPKEEMTYAYSVTDRDLPECSFKDSVTIYPYEIICGEPEVFLPTAFTPNGDGKNEELYLRGKNVKSMELAIYDRWGKLMFNTASQSKGWDGRYKGNPVIPGVYVYYFEARCIDNQRIFRKGNVTIIAN
jgi:gliding motility-associated-like protein